MPCIVSFSLLLSPVPESCASNRNQMDFGSERPKIQMRQSKIHFVTLVQRGLHRYRRWNRRGRSGLDSTGPEGSVLLCHQPLYLACLKTRRSGSFMHHHACCTRTLERRTTWFPLEGLSPNGAVGVGQHLHKMRKKQFFHHASNQSAITASLQC